MMLNTPFGYIQITIDGILTEYHAEPHANGCRSIVEKPLAGCYRITVPAKSCRTIRCEISWNRAPIPNTGDSGERYLCAEFISGSHALTIGAEDENADFDAVRLADGMAYFIRQPVETVTFGVAWADDRSDGDVRTWLAADPLSL